MRKDDRGTHRAGLLHSVSPDLEPAVAVIGLLTLVAMMSLSPSPEAAFVLQLAAGGAGLGLFAAYLRYRDNPEAHRLGTVAGLALAGLVAGLVLVALERLSLV